MMKQTSKTVKVPAEPESSYEALHWTCEACGYETDDEEDSKAHHAKEHSFLSKQTAGGYTFLWFDTKEDYRAYHQDWASDFNDLSYDGEYFVGPGWYWLKSVEIPCRCGHCGNYATYGVSASELRKELLEKIEAMEAQHDEILTLCNTRPANYHY
jgi:hypothetical protein